VIAQLVRLSAGFRLARNLHVIDGDAKHPAFGLSAGEAQSDRPRFCRALAPMDRIITERCHAHSLAPRRLFRTKSGWKNPSHDKQEHVTPLLKHFMQVTTNVNIKSINAGVISQFKSLIVATLILPRMIAEGKAPKKGGGTMAWAHAPVRRDGNEVLPLELAEITPSVLIKSLGGTNPTLRAWRFASTPQRGEAEKKVLEHEVVERIAEAEKEMANLVERSWEDAAFEMRGANPASDVPLQSMGL